MQASQKLFTYSSYQMDSILLNHKFEYRKQWQLDCGLKYYSWVKSRHHNRYYLILTPKRTIATTGIGILIVCALLGMFLANFPFWAFAGIFSIVIVTAAIVFYTKIRKHKKLPTAPLAAIDFERDLICFYYRPQLACSQPPGNKLQIPLKCLRKAELIHTRIVNDGQYNIRQAVGYSTWQGLYIEYQRPDMQPQKSLVLLGSGLGGQIHDMITMAGKIPIEFQLGKMNIFQ